MRIPPGHHATSQRKRTRRKCSSRHSFLLLRRTDLRPKSLNSRACFSSSQVGRRSVSQEADFEQLAAPWSLRISLWCDRMSVLYLFGKKKVINFVMKSSFETKLAGRLPERKQTGRSGAVRS